MVIDYNRKVVFLPAITVFCLSWQLITSHQYTCHCKMYDSYMIELSVFKNTSMQYIEFPIHFKRMN